ncbi:MAG: sulfite exporter TauE/SafE family protein [Thermoplasmata archaeon]
MTWPILILLVLLVFGVAFLYSNLGLGGGLLYVPILLSLVLFEDVAVPISLTLAAATGISATVNHYRKGLVDLKLAGLLIGGALIGSVIGAIFNLSTSKTVFLAFFVSVIIAVGIKMLHDWITNTRSEDEDDDSRMTSTRKALSANGTLASGFLAGSLGIGGGLVNVPLMVYVLGRKTRKAIGTSSMIIVATSIFGFSSYLLLGTSRPIDFGLIAILWPFVFLGAFVGSRWGLKRLKTRLVALIFILVLFIAAAKMIIDLVLGI